MPNITTTLYLNDEDYKEKFLPNKEEILSKMRRKVCEELDIDIKDKSKD